MWRVNALQLMSRICENPETLSTCGYTPALCDAPAGCRVPVFLRQNGPVRTPGDPEPFPGGLGQSKAGAIRHLHGRMACGESLGEPAKAEWRAGAERARQRAASG